MSSSPFSPPSPTGEAVGPLPGAPGLPWIVQWHDRLGSTSDEARRLAREGAPHGTVVSARTQTAGRGRGRRTWSSPEGNLHASAVLHCQEAAASQLGFVAALAVADAVDEVCGSARARLKWPNDVLLEGAKLAGLLLEVEAGPCQVAVVLGIGINLRHSPEGVGYATTSLHDKGVLVTPERMLGVVLGTLGARFDAWRKLGFDPVLAAWLEKGHWIGEALRISTGAEPIRGTFAGLDRDGSLLALVDGATRRFVSAEVVPT